MSNDSDESASLAEVVRRLRERFPTVPADRVETTVNMAYFHYDGARVRDFVPVLVEREARQHLRSLTAA